MLTIMGRIRLGLPKGGGKALAALAAGFLIGGPIAGQQIAYRPLPPDMTVLGGAPRLPYRALPIDERIAPNDLAQDSDDTLPLSPADQQALDQRLLELDLAQNYTPSPAIWRIGDGDTTIYLFGTIHVLPPGFRWRSPTIDTIVARADTLLLESVDDSSGVDALIAGSKAAGPPLPPLAERVSPDHRAALQRLMDTLPPEAAKIVDGLPTWIAAVAITFVREVRAGEAPGPGADDWLEAAFRAANKPVGAIEDGAKVLASVNAIPVAEQQHMLDLALDAPESSRAEMRATLHAWARGDIGAGSPIAIDMAATGATSLADPLLDARNRAWALSLERRLKTPGTMLFAAGAGHFVGPNSVLALLEQRGIKVSRVE